MIKREKLRDIGIYLIIILCLLMFVLSPLNKSLKDKKTILNGYLEAYEIKAVLAQRKRQVNETVNKSISEQEKELLASLYTKDSLVSEVQIETLEAVTKSVEKNGLNLIHFQLPDTSVSKDLREISIIISVTGMLKDIIGLLKELNEMKMITDVKYLQISTGRKQLFTVKLTLVNYRIES